jgi:hypothetical protein
MNIISKLLNAVAAWLSTVDAPIESPPNGLDWWDLPPHHPQ